MKMQHRRAKALVLSLAAAGAVSLISTMPSTAHAAPRGGRSATTRPARTPGARDIALFEGALGRTLTDTEKTAIAAAAQVRETALSNAQASCRTQIADSVDLSVSDLDAKVQSALAAQQSSKKPGRHDIVALLEGALGRTLTDAEKSAVQAAAAERGTTVQAANEVYRASVAAALGLTVAELDAKVQAYAQVQGRGHGGHGDIVALLEGALGRTLTDAEKTALNSAADSRDAAIQAAVTAYRTSAAATLGLTVAELDAKVQAFAQTQGGGRGGHDGRGGPGERGGHGGRGPNNGGNGDRGGRGPRR